MPGLLGVLPITLFLLMFTTGMVMLFSALTVFFRDIEFLLGVVLQAWFFLTPIVYQFSSVPERFVQLRSASTRCSRSSTPTGTSLYDGAIPAAVPLVECALDRIGDARRSATGPSTA